jgi:hypothetical protein
MWGVTLLGEKVLKKEKTNRGLIYLFLTPQEIIIFLYIKKFLLFFCTKAKCRDMFLK